jgi:glycosyltransferase involved in cell wall biosynthesis
MTTSVYLNGRFLTQSLTGVQRFSAEVTAAIDRLATDATWPETVVLAPRPGVPGFDRGVSGRYQRLRLKEVGRTHGHIWEQTELPAAARGGILVSLGNTAPMLAGSRQVVVIHDAGVFDTPESYSLRFRAWYKALHHGLVRTGAQIVTVSKYSRSRIAARLGLDPARITVIYEGADHILRATPDPGVLQRNGLRPRQFALVVGSLAAHKNLTALTEAATSLQRRNIAVAIAGGFNRDLFQDTPAAGPGVRRLGRVTDGELRALYESAVCLLFPSRYEGFGLPPVEAMICGCPVLASGGGAVEEICGDGAVYFTNDGKSTIAALVERLLDEEGFAEDLRRRGHARAASLSWDAAARSLGEVIQRVRH